MTATIYIESSVVSYYTSKRAHNLVVAARQQITKNWWKHRMSLFKPYISQVVLEEIGRGDRTAASRRTNAVHSFLRLKLTDDVLTLAQELVAKGVIPEQFPEDAAHISVAAVHGMDYLVTWNFTHINNAERKSCIESAIRHFGFEPPVICTPEELMGGLI